MAAVIQYISVLIVKKKLSAYVITLNCRKFRSLLGVAQGKLIAFKP
ncbi:hypothetical protein GPUN_1951 [Glaciecola punicea ACAM 611]|uniref:Uncharacterized protein n=1 Tax=Glaciecola punicea ACAM 611 TaxID=1121923 RepID=H5TCN9_9ALTE|nr:hypothetical protein GPUN_1951 [Glaciecola punicea ACAM 611]